VQTGTLFAGAHAISRSTDGGNTWEQVFDLEPFYGDKANIMGITCFDDYVVCTGGDMLTLVSKDNGATWGQNGNKDICGPRKARRWEKWGVTRMIPVKTQKHLTFFRLWLKIET
jgi:photosystem II stability/assembly factor-like uncharacterized protein